MRNFTPLFMLVAFTTGCSHEPRATAFFDAHSDERARVMKACSKGSQTGVECTNAAQSEMLARNKAANALAQRNGGAWENSLRAKNGLAKH